METENAVKGQGENHPALFLSTFQSRIDDKKQESAA